MKTLDFAHELLGATEKPDIVNICKKFAGHFGFEYFIFADIYATSFSEPTVIIVNGYPLPWRENYVNKRYINIDPVVKHCCMFSTPILWSDIVKNVAKSSPEYLLMQEAAECGLRRGVSFAIHAPQTSVGIFSVATANDTEDTTRQILAVLPEGQLFGAYVHEAVFRLYLSDCNKEMNTDEIYLSKRERECLLWIADGKTSAETAKILNIAEATVTFHLQNVTKKLGASNRVQAVVKAISSGLIQPNL